MLAVRTPVAGIFIAVLVLVGEVVGLRAYMAAQKPGPAVVSKADMHANHFNGPPPKFGRKKRGCADRIRISGPDDAVQPPAR